MLYKKQKHYDGLDCSGECKVLPPTFEGIPALVARLGSPDRVADAFPDRSQQELPDDLFDFLSLWRTSDKVDRELLSQDYNDYIIQLQKDALERQLKAKKSSTPAAPVADPAKEVKLSGNGDPAAPPKGQDTPV